MGLDLIRAPWGELPSSAPILQGGAGDLLDSLISVLKHISGELESPLLPDLAAIERVQKQIGVLGLTTRTADTLRLTELGRDWLRRQDPLELLFVFHSRLAYIGEMLQRLAHGPARVEELLAHASGDYRMAWTSRDQIRRRLAWFRAFGVVSEGPNRLHLITDTGRQALAQIEVVTPEEILSVPGSRLSGELPPAPPLLTQLVAAASAEERTLSLGYLPKNPDQALRTLVESAAGGIARDELANEVARRLSIKVRSALSFLWVGRHMGVVEYTGKEEISPTELGTEWLTSATPLNLVRLMHGRFLAIGEMLLGVAEEPRSAGEIHRAVFGDDPQAPKQSRTAHVLQRLSAAKAIGQIGHARYVITPIGRALIDELPMLTIKPADRHPESTDRSQEEPRPLALREELLAASRDTTHPERFERACAAAFCALGVDAKHVGGPGRTDVLVHVTANLKHLATAIIDAKSSAGHLTEGSVRFEALKEHARKHGADRTVVVAPGYEESGRLAEWAKGNDVVLLTARELADLVESHEIFPLTPEDVVDLLTVGGRTSMQDRRNESESYLSLVQHVLDELKLEAEQEAPEPISARDIARAMRRAKRPADEETVKEVLRFLAEPPIGAVQDAGDGRYTLPASLGVPARRLRALARAVSVDASRDGLLLTSNDATI